MKRTYSMAFAPAMVLALIGGASVLAQNSGAQNKPAANQQQATTQDRAQGMKMQGMMNCCMKMQEQMKDGKSMECPMMKDSGKSEAQPSSKQ